MTVDGTLSPHTGTQTHTDTSTQMHSDTDTQMHSETHRHTQRHSDTHRHTHTDALRDTLGCIQKCTQMHSETHPPTQTQMHSDTETLTPQTHTCTLTRIYTPIHTPTQMGAQRHAHTDITHAGTHHLTHKHHLQCDRRPSRALTFGDFAVNLNSTITKSLHTPGDTGIPQFHRLTQAALVFPF